MVLVICSVFLGFCFPLMAMAIVHSAAWSILAFPLPGHKGVCCCFVFCVWWLHAYVSPMWVLYAIWPWRYGDSALYTYTNIKQNKKQKTKPNTNINTNTLPNTNTDTSTVRSILSQGALLALRLESWIWIQVQSAFLCMYINSHMPSAATTRMVRLPQSVHRAP